MFGETACEPEAPTFPKPVIETDAALAVFQERVEEPPGLGIEAYEASREQEGMWCGVTVTVRWYCTVPPGPVAVKV